jgi:hypothetical protein
MSDVEMLPQLVCEARQEIVSRTAPRITQWQVNAVSVAHIGRYEDRELRSHPDVI